MYLFPFVVRRINKQRNYGARRVRRASASGYNRIVGAFMIGEPKKTAPLDAVTAGNARIQNMYYSEVYKIPFPPPLHRSWSLFRRLPVTNENI